MAGYDGATLVAACLRATGVRRVFVAAGHGAEGFEDAFLARGLEVVPVLDDDLASVLADADGALAAAPDRHPGAALLRGRRLRVTARPGARVEPVEVAIDDLPAVLAGWSLGGAGPVIEVVLPDPTAVADEATQPLDVRREDRLVRLAADLAGLRTVLLVGTRVVREGFAVDVAGAADRIGAAVVATPGAVGVLPPTHPRWCGVVGVQRDDVAGTGLDEAELVLVVGVEDEEPGALVPEDAQVVELEPGHLAFLGLDWPEPPPGRPTPLVEHLGAVLADHRDDEAWPLHPVRAALDVLDAVGDARVAVDAGPVGLWFVRGVLPVSAGRVVAPMNAVEGFAAAAALVGALDGRRVVGLTTPGDSRTASVLDLASAMGVAVVVESWGEDTPVGDPSRHRAALVGALADGTTHLLPVAVDLAAAAELVDIAGPVDLWTEPSGSPFD